MRVYMCVMNKNDDGRARAASFNSRPTSSGRRGWIGEERWIASSSLFPSRRKPSLILLLAGSYTATTALMLDPCESVDIYESMRGRETQLRSAARTAQLDVNMSSHKTTTPAPPPSAYLSVLLHKNPAITSRIDQHASELAC